MSNRHLKPNMSKTRLLNIPKPVPPLSSLMTKPKIFDTFFSYTPLPISKLYLQNVSRIYHFCPLLAPSLNHLSPRIELPNEVRLSTLALNAQYPERFYQSIHPIISFHHLKPSSGFPSYSIIAKVPNMAYQALYYLEIGKFYDHIFSTVLKSLDSWLFVDT